MVKDYINTIKDEVSIQVLMSNKLFQITRFLEKKRSCLLAASLCFHVYVHPAMLIEILVEIKIEVKIRFIF